MTDYTGHAEKAVHFAAQARTANLALQAVLDMHKPETPKKWVPVRCNHCRTPYPCPTVRTIQDAIGDKR